jgi:hypothetical protein
MRAVVGAGKITSAAGTMYLYVKDLIGRAPFVNNVIVLFGDDAPMESPYTEVYAALDQVLECTCTGR